MKLETSTTSMSLHLSSESQNYSHPVGDPPLDHNLDITDEVNESSASDSSCYRESSSTESNIDISLLIKELLDIDTE